MGLTIKEWAELGVRPDGEPMSAEEMAYEDDEFDDETCAHCGVVIRVTASGTNWTDSNGSDTCQGSDLSHEPAATS